MINLLCVFNQDNYPLWLNQKFQQDDLVGGAVSNLGWHFLYAFVGHLLDFHVPPPQMLQAHWCLVSHTKYITHCIHGTLPNCGSSLLVGPLVDLKVGRVLM